MTGRLSKLRRRGDSPPAGPPAAGLPDPSAAPPAAAVPTLFADAPALPADVEPGADAQPSFRDRGQYRRRLRYLRRVRELGFRDLGGLVFDLHRFQRPGDQLIAGKLAALDAVDRELRALERVMRDEHAFTDLREPGIAACARCGALHGSDARFCPSCGISLAGPRTLSELPVVAPSPPAGSTAPVGAAFVPVPAAPAPAAPAPAPGVPAPSQADAPADHVAADPEPVTEIIRPDEAPDAPAAPADADAATQGTADPAPRADADHAGARPVSAAGRGSQPVSAAALGLPVPTPPPVPPYPGPRGGDAGSPGRG